MASSWVDFYAYEPTFLGMWVEFLRGLGRPRLEDDEYGVGVGGGEGG
jgi:hypothetical protein